MERKRGTTVAVVAALIIAVVSLGIAFAAFSTTLTINGSATVQATSWNIFFAPSKADEKSSTPVALTTDNITTTGTAASTQADLSASTFTWAATLKTPGDSVRYTFVARNTGDYNAKIRSIVAPQLTCEFADKTTAQTFCNNHVTYGVYKDAACTQPVAANDTLTKADGYATYYVKVELLNNFAENGSDLPTQNVNITSNTISVIYEQDGNAVTTP